MKMEELAARLMAETDRAAAMVKDDWMPLEEQQLIYRVHVNHCNILEILLQVLSVNSSLLDGIERAIPYAHPKGRQEEYRPGWFAKYMLNRMASARCHTGKIKNQDTGRQELSMEMLFSKIMEQQNRFKELVTLCKTVDMNSRVVPFRLHGLIRLSLAETFEYLVLYQKRHFMMARQIWMVLQGGGRGNV